MSYCPIMEEHLFLVHSYVANVKGSYDSTFTGPNSAIISDSCDSIGNQIHRLIEFSFHAFLSRTLSSLLYVHLFYCDFLVVYVSKLIAKLLRDVCSILYLIQILIMLEYVASWYVPLIVV